jgi:hypothetical protein
LAILPTGYIKIYINYDKTTNQIKAKGYRL